MKGVSIFKHMIRRRGGADECAPGQWMLPSSPGDWDWNPHAQDDTQDSSKQRQTFLSCSPCLPPDYRSLSADRNLFRGEGVANVQNPIFALALFCLRRNPYFEAVLRDSQSSRPDADTASPSPTVACAPNVTQRLARLKGINDSSNQSQPDRERADRSLI